MSGLIALQKDLKRWYTLIDHPVQDELWGDVLKFVEQFDKSIICDTELMLRFFWVAAGRRSGKTERAKRLLAKIAMMYDDLMLFAAAPTQAQAERIFYNDLKKLTLSSTHRIKPVKGLIRLNNGSSITIMGLDSPSRIEGSNWHGGLIDEYADLEEGIWGNNLRPLFDTRHPDGRRAFCIFTGVPEGRNHYYEQCQYAMDSGDSEHKFYTWHSKDILGERAIEAAKRSMSAMQFRQEYEASFETAQGLIYPDYGKLNHAKIEPMDTEPLFWAHDFNFDPMSSVVGVVRDNSIFCFDEIVIRGANPKMVAWEFVDKFRHRPCKTVKIYGDASGHAGEKHVNESAYITLEQILRQNDWNVRMCVPRSNPLIKERQNALRAKISNANSIPSLFVDIDKCKYLNKGLHNQILKEGSSFLEEETDTQHITTAIGYMAHYEYPVMLDLPKKPHKTSAYLDKNNVGDYNSRTASYV